MSKPFSQAAENNKAAILEVLQLVLADSESVLEIGSGTGQHATYFAARLPHLIWQTSDLEANHAGINEWIDDCEIQNVRRPIFIDASVQPWNTNEVDAVYTANTFHIMSWQEVEDLFAGLDAVLKGQAKLVIYGPFNYDGKFTSESNERFNEWLGSEASHRAIRDFESVDSLAKSIGLRLLEDHAMPANNRLLVWVR